MELNEKEKYEKAWQSGAENNSRCAYPMISYIEQHNPKWKMLEIGCGNGLTLMNLRQKGFEVHGIDITLEGLKLHRPLNKFNNQNVSDYSIDLTNIYECPIWNTPFADDEFDLTYSSDVLEHIPSEYLEQSIQEIYRITKFKTFHNIATFPDSRKGFVFHLSIFEIEKWRKLFEEFRSKNIDVELIDRTDFLKKWD